MTCSAAALPWTVFSGCSGTCTSVTVAGRACSRISEYGVSSQHGQVAVFVAVAVESVSRSRRISVTCSLHCHLIVVASSPQRRRIVAAPSSRRRRIVVASSPCRRRSIVV